MKKRLLSLALALVLSLGLMAPASAASSGYSDVPSTHWSADSVRRATELGLFEGVGGGRFGLGQPITRAAFVTALVRLFGWRTVSPSKASYTDVSAGSWYYSAVETARANGAFASTSGAFHPTDNITREEMAVMIVRSLDYASLAGTASGYASPFLDVTTNKGFITLAYDMGIVGGVGDGKFAPDSSATREQAAAMLVRLYERLYASSIALTSLSGYTPITVATPAASDGDALPTTPLEPIGELYAQLRSSKNRGVNMSRAALCLNGGGVRTITANGKIVSTDTLTADQVASILSGSGVRTYYSTRYESAYCIYKPNSYQSATLWYQSEESQAAKLQLARLFGVTHYTLS